MARASSWRTSNGQQIITEVVTKSFWSVARPWFAPAQEEADPQVARFERLEDRSLLAALDPLGSAVDSQDSHRVGFEPALLPVRRSQVNGAIFLDGSNDRRVDGNIGFETDLALDELLSETLRLLA